MDEQFYTTDELAALKGVKVDAVRMMVRKGRLHPMKTVNGSQTYLFDEVEKNRYMAIHPGNPNIRNVGRGRKAGAKERSQGVDNVPRSAGNG